ncbi:hypothetical protein PFISCL1PPCAC_2400 [Pristionchus fissidentatus]|uniref:Glycosyltransferase family 92 protein n=1 Tax=Pristionchus fissidentatus TaxID=1538716 RepID=A0AAV5UWI3_9BILA|nr:hypothetical protein PFISCL1PPCAC_2400 [Pristionchus fissidentatus]
MSIFRFSGKILPLLVLILTTYFLISTTSLLQLTRSFRTIHIRKHIEPIFLYRAYYDNRTGPGRLRVLAISTCLSTTDRIFINYGSYSIPLVHRPIEKYCPWQWAPDCKWNAFHFEAPASDYTPHMNVTLPGRSLQMPVHTLPELTETLQICVPPLYWYDDWPRLVLFVEFWKREDAAIMIYVNSISANVKRVIDYYENEGAIRVVNWPMLPELRDEDPNRSIYRLSHSLAHNNCVLRSSSKYTTLLDLDEFIIVRNTSLLDFVRSQIDTDPTVGSMQFVHRGLVSNIPVDENFDAIDTMEARVVDGPSKVLFTPSSTLFLSTHFVNTHVEGFHGTTISPDEAFLLHNRISFGDKKIGEEIEFNDKFPLDLKDRIIETRDIIFGSNTPKFSLNVTNKVVRCTSSWRHDGCKTPISSCYSTLISMEDWIFVGPSIDSNFSVL